MNSFLTAWSPRILSVLRIITGFLLVAHGSQKLFNLPPSPQGGGGASGLMLVAGILEFGGGLLFLIGLFTRPAAFILSGLMAVAYYMAHAPQGFLPLVNKGELAVLYCFVFLYFVFSGGGEWSLDKLIWKRD
ncbi:MAG: DoxX family protein [Acidobacteriota bacterium]|nr:DoxX family protein [Acidobacteriota bacterium]